MDTFGDRLRSEREERGLSVSAVAQVLRVDQDRLLALEHNDFDALPDEAAMVDCLRAYAECLHVDADLMIEDYVRERRKCLHKLEDAVTEQAAEAAPAAALADAYRRSRFSPWLAGVALVAVAVLAAWWMLPGDGTAPRPEEPVAAARGAPQPVSPKTPAAAVAAETQPASPKTPVANVAAETQPASSETRAEIARTPAEPPAERSAPTTPGTSALSIPEYGVGTAVESRELVGQSNRFSEGTQVWFWTRVQGGSRGDRIDHVWLREGVEARRIPLKIGGSSWRTYSAKTLHAGAAGDWAVEARDEAGRVLARREFACVQ